MTPPLLKPAHLAEWTRSGLKFVDEVTLFFTGFPFQKLLLPESVRWNSIRRPSGFTITGLFDFLF